MPVSTPEMNAFVDDYMSVCCERDVVRIAEMSVDDENGGFFGVHSGASRDEAVADTIAKLRFAPRAHCHNSKTKGYYVGDFAWFLSLWDGECPDGFVVPIRGTTAMRKVDGQWKVCSFHVSEAVDRSEHMKAASPKDAHK